MLEKSIFRKIGFNYINILIEEFDGSIWKHIANIVHLCCMITKKRRIKQMHFDKIAITKIQSERKIRSTTKKTKDRLQQKCPTKL